MQVSAVPGPAAGLPSTGLPVNPDALSSDIDSIVAHESWVKNTWAQGHLPAANTQATTTKAAPGAGLRNVCTGITATIAASAAPAAVVALVVLRDGATGVGAVLWADYVALTAVAGAVSKINLSGLRIRGSANTQMTLEFALAGGANTLEVVSMQGAIETV